MPNLVTGYLALMTAAGDPWVAGATELVATGYARQPVAFSMPQNGISRLASAYSFGSLGMPSSTIAGRALYASPTATVPLLVLPFGNGARNLPGGGPSDAGGSGDITLILPAMQAYADGAAFFGVLGAQGAHTVGTTYDAVDQGLAKWANGATSSPPFSTAAATSIRSVTQAPLYIGSDAFTVAAGVLSPAGVAGAT